MTKVERFFVLVGVCTTVLGAMYAYHVVVFGHF